MLQYSVSVLSGILVHLTVKIMHLNGLPWWLSKESACNVGDPGLIPSVRKIPWRREWLPTRVFLPGEFHGQRRPVGYNSMGSQRVGHN